LNTQYHFFQVPLSGVGGQSDHFCFSLAVKNGYIDLSRDDDFFDLTYADLSQLKPNFVFSLHLNAFKNG